MHVASTVPRYVVGGLMILIMALVNLEVALRFFLNLPLASVSEITGLLFVWVSLLGAAVAVDQGGHMALHLLSARLAGRTRSALRAGIALAILIFGVFLVVHGSGYARVTLHELTNVLNIPISWEVAAFPVGGGLIILYCATSLGGCMRVWLGHPPGGRAGAAGHADPVDPC